MKKYIFSILIVEMRTATIILTVFIVIIIIALIITIILRLRKNDNPRPTRIYIEPYITTKLSINLSQEKILQTYKSINESFSEKYYLYLSDAGLFSELNNMISAMIMCLIDQKQLVINDTQWNWNQWDKYFKPFCEIDRDHKIDKKDSIHRYNSPLWKEVRKPKTVQEYCQYFDIDDVFQRKAILAPIVFQFHDRLNIIPMQIPPPYLAVHIRRGDKINTEMKDIPVDIYTQKIKELSQLLGLNNIFYASDDMTYVNKLHPQELTKYTLPSNQKSGHYQANFNVSSPEYKMDEFKILVTEVVTLAQSAFLLCTYSSNLTRFVALLRKSLDSSLSLDEPWNSL